MALYSFALNESGLNSFAPTESLLGLNSFALTETGLMYGIISTDSSESMICTKGFA